MAKRKYDRATAEVIFKMIGWPESWFIQDDGVFVEDGHRLHSPSGHAFDWKPAYEMDWSGAPNPMTAPVLPIPFTANDLAACMLDGCGHGIQGALDRRIGYALDDEALERFTLYGRWARDALRDAYALAAKAQIQVGAFDFGDEQEAYALMKQAGDANGEANKREGVFESGITSEEASRRRERAIASVADLQARARQSDAAVQAKWFAWRKAMVRELLHPGDSTPDSAPVEAAGASGAVEPDKATPAKALQRTAAQDSAILCEIGKQGYDPLALPKNFAGKPGVKAAIRAALSQNSLFAGGTVFNKAWERLTARADIAIRG